MNMYLCTPLNSMWCLVPQLRKAAQGSVVSILCEGTPTGDYHPAAALTTKHCRHVLSQGGKGDLEDWGVNNVSCDIQVQKRLVFMCWVC